MDRRPCVHLTNLLPVILFPGLIWLCDATIQVTRPRGVSLSNEPLYRQDAQWFTCLDGSMKIPRTQLNDDYCDCPDFSDEPGTSACPGGKFHCNNRGHKPMYIPSSRVNDGICDCCDASDEYEGTAAGVCVNICKELGKKELEAKRQEIVLHNQGFDIRQGYIKDGQAKKTERQESLQKLKTEREETSTVLDEKRRIRDEAEEPEKEATERHKAAWEAEEAARRAAEETAKALDAFKDIDANGDGKVTADEVQNHNGFDTDNSGDINEEEVKTALGENEFVDEATFVEQIWINIQNSFKSTSQLRAEEAAAQEQQGREEPQPPGEDEDVATFDEFEDEDDEEEDFDDDMEEEDWEDDDDEEIDDDAYSEETREQLAKLRRERRRDRMEKRRQQRKEKNKDGEEGDGMPEYDEETKKLIEIANQARNEFAEAENNLKSIDRSISDIEKQLQVDLGPEQEFQPLQNQCYEFTDREYVYKLCPFDRTSQKQKHGGSETSLGTWNNWDGPSDNKYTAMSYTRGQKCWNGPDRSTKVILKCGIDNQVISATEPDKCVYQFEFTTPALCKFKYDLSTGESIDKHDEL